MFFNEKRQICLFISACPSTARSIAQLLNSLQSPLHFPFANKAEVGWYGNPYVHIIKI